jgi:hypothetical protein
VPNPPVSPFRKGGVKPLSLTLSLKGREERVRKPRPYVKDMRFRIGTRIQDFFRGLIWQSYLYRA